MGTKFPGRYASGMLIGNLYLVMPYMAFTLIQSESLSVAL
jgi:hypothetical protein